MYVDLTAYCTACEIADPVILVVVALSHPAGRQTGKQTERKTERQILDGLKVFLRKTVMFLK